MVLAPESGQASFTADELREMPNVMARRVMAATKTAMGLRRYLASQQTGEASR